MVEGEAAAYWQSARLVISMSLVRIRHGMRCWRYNRVTSVRENQGKSGKMDLFGENQGKIREFHYESVKKSGLSQFIGHNSLFTQAVML